MGGSMVSVRAAEPTAAPSEAQDTVADPTLLETHASWLTRLREHVYGGRSLDPATAARHDDCDLAHWLERVRPQLHERTEYWHTRALHARFHRRAARIASLANAGRRIEAELELAPGGEVRQLSADLVRSIAALQRLAPR